MAENFLNQKEMDVQVQKAQRVPNKMNLKRPMPRYIISKMEKVKERILKAAREKQRVMYKGTSMRQSADFSAGTLWPKRKWHDICKVLKGKNLQPRILYPARLSFRIKGEIRNFSDKQKLRVHQY